MPETEPRDWLAEVVAALSDIPAELNPREFLLIRTLVCELLARSTLGIRSNERSAHKGHITALAVARSPSELRLALEAIMQARAGADSLHTLALHDTFSHGLFRVSAALAYIQQHACDPGIRLRHVAQHVGLSKWHLSRLLTRAGHHFEKLVHDKRTQQAAVLLQTAMSIKEIAASVGYSHTNILDRHFREVYGLTPTAYRAARCGEAHVDAGR